MLLLLQIPVTAPDSWTSFCVSLHTKSSLSVSRRRRENYFFGKHVRVPTHFLSGSSGGGGGVWGVWVDDREASGSRNGWSETETEGEKERWMQLCALVKGKVTLWATSSLDTATLVAMETQFNEHTHRKIAANHSISVLKVHGGNLYLQTVLVPSLPLPSFLSVSHPTCFCCCV